eukprot:4798736-Prymnesium_polylepis.1
MQESGSGDDASSSSSERVIGIVAALGFAVSSTLRPNSHRDRRQSGCSAPHHGRWRRLNSKRDRHQ